jgi:hypothetical protein
MALLARQEQSLAVGLAVPPASMLLPAPLPPAEPGPPAWVGTTLAVTGEFAPAEGEELDEAARLAAARRDGVEKLRRAIDELVVGEDTTVAAVLAGQAGLADDLAVFLASARAGPPGVTADAVAVPLELPLRRLWWIVRRGLLDGEMEKPAAAARRPAERDMP